MTVSSETASEQFAGDGSTVTFSPTFLIFEEGHIEVFVDETLQTLNTDYTVANEGAPPGFDVTFTTAPAAGTVVTVRRTVPLTQETDYLANDPFPAETHERALDLATMMAQQLKALIDKAVLLPVSSQFSDITIPDPEAAKFLRWNAAATALENAEITGSGSIGIPVSLAQGGTNATTAAGARTNLGLGEAAVENVQDTGAGDLLREDGDGSGLVNTAWEVLESAEISGQASLDLTNLSTTHRAFKLVFTGLVPASDVVVLWLRTSADNGSTFTSAAGSYAHLSIGASSGGAPGAKGSNSDTEIELVEGVGSAAGEELSGEITIYEPASSSGKTRITWHIGGLNSSANFRTITGSGERLAAEINDAIRLVFSSGNIGTMRYTLYGLRAA